MADLNAMRELLADVLNSGPMGIECNCGSYDDPCTGECTRTRVMQAICEIDQLPQFTLTTQDGISVTHIADKGR